VELEGVVHNGVIVPDDATSLPEGMRVRITPAPLEATRPFGERFAQFKGAVPDLPADLAEQHDHYRLPGLHAGAIQTAPDFEVPLQDDFWAGQK
jgi:hypothetical protein